MTAFRLLVHSASQVVQVTCKGEIVLAGRDMNRVALLQTDSTDSTEGYSVVVARNGFIVAVGSDKAVQSQMVNATFDEIIDATGKCILPGLVDAHTHPVWAGDRVHEFSMKLRGASYMEIHAAGGGIGFTVKETRKASDEQLLQLLKDRIDRMMRAGTTLMEAKSGYGLDAQSEIRLLKILNKAVRNTPMDMSITFCGAHSIPEGLTSEEATQLVLNEQIPLVNSTKMEDESFQVENIDVFCEKNVFNVNQTERIARAGMDIGLNVNIHGDELSPIGAAEMAASLGASAVSHLEEISAKGMREMSTSGTVAVLCPTTAYVLKLKSPPVRKMINAGVAVALGSDFNPNIFCTSMPLTMHLACVLFGMTMDEALVASTINAAASINKSKDYGSIEVNKMGDLIIINAPRWEHLIYQLGGHDHLIDYVIKAGTVVHRRKIEE